MGPADYFINGDLLPDYRSRMGSRPLLLLLGRVDDDWEARIRAQIPNAQVAKLVGADFSFHSSERDVRAIVTTAVGAGVEVTLFHNFAGRLRKAFRDGPPIKLPARRDSGRTMPSPG